MKCQRRLVQLRWDVSGIDGGVSGDIRSFYNTEVFFYLNYPVYFRIKKRDPTHAPISFRFVSLHSCLSVGNHAGIIVLALLLNPESDSSRVVEQVKNTR